ncbi:family 43 glycosylhydrolase [Cellulomonas fimi]|nr:family 43 glycosylhydrolase [Cellulomonas fimi]
MTLPTRPVLAGFHPDPTVCRVGDTYYLACSSFEYAPGVPLFRSRDLVTWELVGHALDRPSQLRLDGVAPSGGVYAPTLRHHDGRFWLVTTNVSDGPGHLVVTATDPAGPWSEPVHVRAATGIDPDLAWDEDGTCYLTWSDGGIVQAVLDPTTGELLGEPQKVWGGAGGKDVESPHLYRVDGTWYLLVAEGGTAAGHAAAVARGPSPSGPFESNPANPVLTARGTASVVQNTGHADLVQRPDGTWAAVFLGVRTAGYFPSWHVLGRETFATEIRWVDGWPQVGAPVEPSGPDTGATQTLGTDALPGDWVGAGVFPADVLRRSDDAWVLAARPDERTFVGRRQQHRSFVATAVLTADDPGAVGGLELRIDPTHAVTAEVTGGHVRAVARVGPLVQVLGEADLPTGAAVVVEARPSAAAWYSHERGPDEVVVAVDGAHGRVELGSLDGRYLSTEVAGGFTGRLVGLVASAGEVAVHAFTYTGAAGRAS